METTKTKTTTPARRKTTTTARKPRTTAAKPATAKAPAAKPATTKATAPKPTAAKPAAASPAATPKPDAPEDTRFKRQNLISAVADRSSVKRSEVKEVVELVLEELGKAIDAGDELVLQPLGKVMVKQRKDNPNGAQLTVKLKRPGSGSN